MWLLKEEWRYLPLWGACSYDLSKVVKNSTVKSTGLWVVVRTYLFCLEDYTVEHGLLNLAEPQVLEAGFPDGSCGGR